jgi:hypothetical protein
LRSTFKVHHMSLPAYRPPAPPRVVRANNSLEKVLASLDSHSAARLAWIQHWHRVNTKADPQAAVVIRRALEVYARHLNAMGESLNEVPAIKAASKGSGSAVSLTEARARIEQAQLRPLDLDDCINGHEVMAQRRKDIVELEARVEELLA